MSSSESNHLSLVHSVESVTHDEFPPEHEPVEGTRPNLQLIISPDFDTMKPRVVNEYDTPVQIDRSVVLSDRRLRVATTNERTPRQKPSRTEWVPPGAIAATRDLARFALNRVVKIVTRTS